MLAATAGSVGKARLWRGRCALGVGDGLVPVRGWEGLPRRTPR